MSAKMYAPAPSTYLLPLGLGIAYGLNGRGLLLPWPLEALIYAFSFPAVAILLKTDLWKSFVQQAHSLSTKPSILVFVFLQTMLSGGLVFVPAIAISAIKAATS